MGPLERREVYYRGRVQGVGFRYTVCQVARRHEVSGFVENLPDGRVHMIAEGAIRTLNEFLADVDEAMAGYVHHRAIDKTAATGEFAGFGIRW